MEQDSQRVGFGMGDFPKTITYLLDEVLSKRSPKRPSKTPMKTGLSNKQKRVKRNGR
jgi:hypothetical protein